MRVSTLEQIEVFLEELIQKFPNGSELFADANKTLRRASSHIVGMIVFWVRFCCVVLCVCFLLTSPTDCVLLLARGECQCACDRVHAREERAQDTKGETAADV